MSVEIYVTLVGSDGGEKFEFLVEPNGTLLVENIQEFFLGAYLIKYKTANGAFRIIRVDPSGKMFSPPSDGWGNKECIVICKKVDANEHIAAKSEKGYWPLKLFSRYDDSTGREILCELSRLSAEVNRLSVELTNLNTKIDNIQKELNTKIDNSEKTVTTKIDNVSKELNTKIDNVEQTLTSKIDNVEKSLTAKIDNIQKELNTKIDNSEKSINNNTTLVKNHLISELNHCSTNLTGEIYNLNTNLNTRIDGTNTNLNTRMDGVSGEINEVKSFKLQIYELIITIAGFTIGVAMVFLQIFKAK